MSIVESIFVGSDRSFWRALAPLNSLSTNRLTFALFRDIKAVSDPEKNADKNSNTIKTIIAGIVYDTSGLTPVECN